MTNVVKAFAPNTSKLVNELRENWFDYSRLQEISQRILAMHGRATLNEVLSYAAVQAVFDAGTATAQVERLEELLTEHGLSMADALKPDMRPIDPHGL